MRFDQKFLPVFTPFPAFLMLYHFVRVQGRRKNIAVHLPSERPEHCYSQHTADSTAQRAGRQHAHIHFILSATLILLHCTLIFHKVNLMNAQIHTLF